MKRVVVPNEIQGQIINDYINGSSVLSLTKKYGYKYDKTYSIIKNNGIEIRGNDYNSKVYSVDSHVFDVIDTEEKAYWLGFLYADGCVMSTGSNYKLSLAISTEDIDHLRKFQKFLKTNNPIKVYKGNHNNEYCRIYVIDEHLCKQLISKGCTVRKTETLTFPEFLNDDLVRHFIRGYIDGDGCITFHKHQINHDRLVFALKICGTKELLTDFHRRLPINKKTDSPVLQKRRKNDVNNYSLEYGGNLQALRLLDYLYGDSNIYLNRKYERYLLLANYCSQ